MAKMAEIDRLFRAVAEFQPKTDVGKDAKSQKLNLLEERSKTEKDALESLYATLEVATLEFLAGEVEGEDTATVKTEADGVIFAS